MRAKPPRSRLRAALAGSLDERRRHRSRRHRSRREPGGRSPGRRRGGRKARRAVCLPALAKSRLFGTAVRPGLAGRGGRGTRPRRADDHGMAARLAPDRGRLAPAAQTSSDRRRPAPAVRRATPAGARDQVAGHEARTPAPAFAGRDRSPTRCARTDRDSPPGGSCDDVFACRDFPRARTAGPGRGPTRVRQGTSSEDSSSAAAWPTTTSSSAPPARQGSRPTMGGLSCDAPCGAGPDPLERRPDRAPLDRPIAPPLRRPVPRSLLRA